jgi:hypothetical protein
LIYHHRMFAYKVSSIAKVKVVPLHATKALGWRGDIAPAHSLHRRYRGVSRQRHAPAALCPGKGPPVPIVQEAGWASDLV